jgi:GNAT superfamily N-acetyltransferase
MNERAFVLPTMITVRPIASVNELIRVERVISGQFPPRRGAPADCLDVCRARFQADQMLMLVAESDAEILGGALAFRAGDAVKVEVIALKPEARRLGVGRRLIEAIEVQAIRVARGIFLGGANAQNRGFYWRLGFAGRRSLMQKALPASRRVAGRTRSA